MLLPFKTILEEVSVKPDAFCARFQAGCAQQLSLQHMPTGSDAVPTAPQDARD
jgi:hypothetical protein